MTDSVLIVNGHAHQIWRGKSKDDIPPLHPDLVKGIVETDNEVNEGDAYDGASFSKPAVDPKAEARKSLARSDREMIRAAEDIWEALRTKGVVTDNDLPQETRDRISARRVARLALKE